MISSIQGSIQKGSKRKTTLRFLLFEGGYTEDSSLENDTKSVLPQDPNTAFKTFNFYTMGKRKVKASNQIMCTRTTNFLFQQGNHVKRVALMYWLNVHKK